jgi:hypothetical protein
MSNSEKNKEALWSPSLDYGFCIRDTGFWPSGPHHPSGALGGSGQLAVLYISEQSQHFFEQKLTGPKHAQMPEKLVWYGSPSILAPHSAHLISTVPYVLNSDWLKLVVIEHSLPSGAYHGAGDKGL